MTRKPVNVQVFCNGDGATIFQCKPPPAGQGVVPRVRFLRSDATFYDVLFDAEGALLIRGSDALILVPASTHVVGIGCTPRPYRTRVAPGVARRPGTGPLGLRPKTPPHK